MQQEMGRDEVLGDIDWGDGDGTLMANPPDGSDNELDSNFHDSDYEDLLFDTNIGNLPTIGQSHNKAISNDFSWTDDEAASDGRGSDIELSDDEAGNKRHKYPEFNQRTDLENPTFKVGMVFPSTKVFKEAVKEHAIKSGKEIKFVKNDSLRVRVVCGKTCNWVILA